MTGHPLARLHISDSTSMCGTSSVHLEVQTGRLVITGTTFYQTHMKHHPSITPARVFSIGRTNLLGGEWSCQYRTLSNVFRGCVDVDMF